MNPAYPFDLARGKKSGLSFWRDTEMRVILKEEIVQKLRKVGLEKGDAVMVHTSLKRMGRKPNQSAQIAAQARVRT